MVLTCILFVIIEFLKHYLVLFPCNGVMFAGRGSYSRSVLRSLGAGSLYGKS